MPNYQPGWEGARLAYKGNDFVSGEEVRSSKIRFTDTSDNATMFSLASMGSWVEYKGFEILRMGSVWGVFFEDKFKTMKNSLEEARGWVDQMVLGTLEPSYSSSNTPTRMFEQVLYRGDMVKLEDLNSLSIGSRVALPLDRMFPELLRKEASGNGQVGFFGELVENDDFVIS